MDGLKSLSETIIVYIGTYTRRESFVDGKGEGIYAYAMDPGSGALSHRSMYSSSHLQSVCALTARIRRS